MVGRSLPRPLLSILFAATGAASLIYQVGWQRVLGTLLGSSSESATIIVAVFLTGLGAGSLLGGALSRRRRGLLLWFALFEGGVGLYGLGSIPLFRSLAAWVTPTLGVTLGLSLLLLILPTLAMGASLPLLVQYRKQAAPGRTTGRILARLYFANTIGAAAAALATVLWLFAAFGLQGAVRFAAGLNIGAAAGALLIHCREFRALPAPRGAS